MSKEAMKQALTHEIDLVLTDPESKLSGGAQRALQYVYQQIQSIAEAEKQEPVSIDWSAVHEKLELVWYRELSADEGLDEIQDLIDTTPQQRKPLTDREIGSVIDDVKEKSRYASHHFGFWIEFCRAIEAAHGIKGEA